MQVRKPSSTYKKPVSKLVYDSIGCCSKQRSAARERWIDVRRNNQTIVLGTALVMSMLAGKMKAKEALAIGLTSFGLAIANLAVNVVKSKRQIGIATRLLGSVFSEEAMENKEFNSFYSNINILQLIFMKKQ